MKCGRGWKKEWCGVVCSIENKTKERGKERFTLLMSSKICESIETHGWKESKIVWAIVKVGIVKYAWVCVYATVNVSI